MYVDDVFVRGRRGGVAGMGIGIEQATSFFLPTPFFLPSACIETQGKEKLTSRMFPASHDALVASGPKPSGSEASSQ